jgi:hypothetical protein
MIILELGLYLTRAYWSAYPLSLPLALPPPSETCFEEVYLYLDLVCLKSISAVHFPLLLVQLILPLFKHDLSLFDEIWHADRARRTDHFETGSHAELSP